MTVERFEVARIIRADPAAIFAALRPHRRPWAVTPNCRLVSAGSGRY
jgi:hypothetical protein